MSRGTLGEQHHCISICVLFVILDEDDGSLGVFAGSAESEIVNRHLGAWARDHTARYGLTSFESILGISANLAFSSIAGQAMSIPSSLET